MPDNIYICAWNEDKSYENPDFVAKQEGISITVRKYPISSLRSNYRCKTYAAFFLSRKILMLFMTVAQGANVGWIGSVNQTFRKEFNRLCGRDMKIQCIENSQWKLTSHRLVLNDFWIKIFFVIFATTLFHVWYERFPGVWIHRRSYSPGSVSFVPVFIPSSIHAWHNLKRRGVDGIEIRPSCFTMYS